MASGCGFPRANTPKKCTPSSFRALPCKVRIGRTIQTQTLLEPCKHMPMTCSTRPASTWGMTSFSGGRLRLLRLHSLLLQERASRVGRRRQWQGPPKMKHALALAMMRQRRARRDKERARVWEQRRRRRLLLLQCWWWNWRTARMRWRAGAERANLRRSAESTSHRLRRHCSKR